MKSTEISESSLLNEFKMSPANLRTLASSINAIAGMEFEMAVPSTGPGYSEEPGIMPDYDHDFRPKSIEAIINFFRGDYNSNRELERVENDLFESYREYAMDELAKDWQDEAEAETLSWIRRTNPDASEEDISQQLDNAMSIKNIDYRDAYDNWAADQPDPRHSEWLNEKDLTSMQAVADEFNLTWPYWVSDQYDDEASEISLIADDFSQAVGRGHNFSTKYHGAQRSETKYSIEPDGSIDTEEGDLGIEFISPPMPVDSLLADLKLVKEWAGLYGCYTNDSTGLHISVSIKDYSRDKLDYVKLAILLGDEYVLDQFNRQGNEYAKSAARKIKNTARSAAEAEAILDAVKSGMNAEVSRLISSWNSEKNVSINAKSGYVEFRSPGGDWLNEDLSKIEATLLRFVVALDAALDETKYKQEYLKKLYKILAPKNKTDPISYFAKYVAGELDKKELTGLVKTAQLERNYDKNSSSEKDRYWFKVSLGAGSVELVASSKQEAIEKARAEFGVQSAFHPESAFKVSVVKRYIPDSD